MRTKSAASLPATALDAMLMGLLEGGPRAGYELRKALVGSPLKHFSESPGAVYPALRRLEANGWVVPVTDAPGGRGRRDLKLTPRGRAALLSWLGRPVSREDVVWRQDELALRFAFLCPALPLSEAKRFLKDFLREIQGHLVELRRFRKEMAPGMTPTGRLAFDGGVALYEARARWARGALTTLGRRSR